MGFLTVLLYAVGINLFVALSGIATASPLHTPEKKQTKHLRPVIEPRGGSPEFAQGEPISASGGGAPISGPTNHYLDVQNPDNLDAESTDAGTVVNLKWSFSDSHTRILNGGWVREQTITDLPSSTDVAAAQQHLTQGSIRELHWHSVNEWAYVYTGRVSISAVDDMGRNLYEELNAGDIWYFPQGSAHTIQGLDEQNEYLQIFDDGNFDALGTTFMVDDWIAHTPKDVLAKNFGVNESVFSTIPASDPYILNSTVNPNDSVTSPYGLLSGNSSYVFRQSQQTPIVAPGGGGTLSIIDSTNFPIAQTIASAIVELKPGALREMHWHPNAQEWILFFSGTAKATVFLGSATARTFDFSAGDTAVFPSNAGHYIENTSNETLKWVEIYKSDRVVDVSLMQWLALTPADIVARTLNISKAVVNSLKKEKQLIIA